MVCLKDRNKAINLKLLKRYLNFDVSKRRWADVTDRVFAKNVPAAPVVSPETRINPFLQTWSPLLLPRKEPCRMLIKTAREFGVQLDGLNIETALKQKCRHGSILERADGTVTPKPATFQKSKLRLPCL
jgi:hypothetical protein